MENEPFDLNDYISQRKEKDYEFASGLCIPILWVWCRYQQQLGSIWLCEAVLLCLKFAFKPPVCGMIISTFASMSPCSHSKDT